MNSTITHHHEPSSLRCLYFSCPSRLPMPCLFRAHLYRSRIEPRYMSLWCDQVLNPIRTYLWFSRSNSHKPSMTPEEIRKPWSKWRKADTPSESKDMQECKYSLYNNSTTLRVQHSTICCDRTTYMTCYTSERSSRLWFERYVSMRNNLNGHMN